MMWMGCAQVFHGDQIYPEYLLAYQRVSSS